MEKLTAFKLQKFGRVNVCIFHETWLKSATALFPNVQMKKGGESTACQIQSLVQLTLIDSDHDY